MECLTLITLERQPGIVKGRGALKSLEPSHITRKGESFTSARNFQGGV
jgi:hypothetical protein